MPKVDLQWINLEDFTPGIHSRVSRAGFTAAKEANPAVAQPTNTYRCVGLEDGGLAPLWKQDYTLTYDVLPGAPPATNQYQITGFFVAQPVQVANNLREHEFFFGIEWIDGTNRKFNLRRYRPFTPAWDAVLAGLTQSSAILPTTDQYLNTHFAITRTLRSAPLTPGVPVVAMSHSTVTPQNPSRQVIFPSDAAPAVTAVATLFDNLYYPSRLLAHQGRLVLFDERTYSHGAVGGWLTNETLLWTIVNDHDTLSSVVASVFSPENPAGYAVVASMSANELFAVKRFGGALTINGDLDNPTVVNLPNVASATSCIPANSPVGLVYVGSDGGVYAWAGGDAAQHISRQLDDYFWRTTAPTILDYRAVLSPIGNDYVALPKLWLFNVHTQSWWRLDDSSLFRQDIWNMQQGFSNVQSPFLYGSTYEFNTTAEVLVYGWDTATPASSYSWQSHPVFATINRNIRVRQVVVEGVGVGTITVTLTGRTGASQSKTFTMDSNSLPQKVRQDYSLQCEAMQVRIESTSGGANPAPITFAVRVGYDDNIGVEAA